MIQHIRWEKGRAENVGPRALVFFR